MIHSMKIPDLLRLLLFITLLSIFNENTLAYRNFSYTEKETGKIGIFPGDSGSFDDGTIMFRLAKRGKSDDCVDPLIRIRLIRPNGKVVTITVQSHIPEFNFCQNILPPGINIDILPMIRDLKILVTYFESKDMKLFQRKGLILNFEGTIQGVPIDLSPLLPPAKTEFLYTIHPIKSFGWIFANSYSEMKQVVWAQFTNPDPDGKVKVLRNQTLNLTYTGAKIFCTLDGSYALAYTRNNTHNITNLSDKLDTQLSSHVTFLRPELKNFGGEFTLWQTSVPLDSFEITSCFFDHFEPGAFCILKIQMKAENKNSKGPLIFLKISFLSTGATYGVMNLSQMVKENLETYYVLPLQEGGYLYIMAITNTSFISFNVYDQDIKLNATAQDIFPNQNFTVVGNYLQSNNSIWFLTIKNHTWNVVSAALPKFVPDNPYDNQQISTSIPKINGTVIKGEQKLSITFNKAVFLSTRNASIFQYDGDKETFRQDILPISDYVNVNNNTVSMTVLSSTFNKPGGKYYVSFDPNFVKDEIGEPILGIESKIWEFSVNQAKSEIHADSVTGLLRLTTECTNKYEGLNKTEKHKFYDNLKSNLSTIIPIDDSRLIPSYKQQYQSASSTRIVLSFKILPDESSESSVKNIANDLDTLVTNKFITAISKTDPSNCLDETFGFHLNPNIWEIYKFQIISIIVGLIVAILIVILANRIYPEGANTAVLRLFLIILHFVFEVLFIVKNGKDVKWLYIPSVAILASTLGINFGLAFFITTWESHFNIDYHAWFSKFGRIASFFTLLAAIDIEALSILSSRFAGLNFFSASYSETTKTWILWGSVLGLVMKAIPQFLVQVLYRKNVVTWDIIPLITLILSAVLLLSNILHKIFFLIQQLKKPKHQKVPNFLKDEEEFNNLKNQKLNASAFDLEPSDSSTVIADHKSGLLGKP